MGERMVPNKYYPPDFHPAKIPRRRLLVKVVRIKLRRTIKCNICRTYIYRGTELNCREEDVIGETYLGIQIFRYCFKCSYCSREITMKVDPQNSDYVVESGPDRNLEPWREEEEATEREEKIRREAKEMGDAMKSLENGAMDSKQDMDILAAAEEMKSVKSRHATVSVEDTMAALKRSSYEKGKSTPGLPSVVGKPADTLTEVSIFNSSENGENLGGSSIAKPKFIRKRRSATYGSPNKKLATESTVNGQPKSEEEGKSVLTAQKKFQILCSRS